MRRFVEQADRGQWTLLPECLDDFIDESNPVRVIDVFVDALDLAEMGFEGAEPAATGRPSYHPSVLLKLYIYGYLNRVQSSRRLEREAGRNVEVMWLLGRLAPDHKTIADFRKDSGLAPRKVCARFVELCREMGLLAAASVAIDGSKFKAVNNRDKNFTRAKGGGHGPAIKLYHGQGFGFGYPPRQTRLYEGRHTIDDHRRAIPVWPVSARVEREREPALERHIVNQKAGTFSSGMSSLGPSGRSRFLSWIIRSAPHHVKRRLIDDRALSSWLCAATTWPCPVQPSCDAASPKFRWA